MKVLLLTPPMTQLNTPYPATAYLTGFLKKEGTPLGIEVAQADPAIELILRLFSKAGLARVKAQIQDPKDSAVVRFFLNHFLEYERTIDAVIRFLQGRDPSLSMRIVSRKFLPEGPRFRSLFEFSEGNPDGDQEQLAWAFGALGVQDQAKYLASLYLDDLADVVREGIDARFEFSRYGEKLAASAASLDPLLLALEEKNKTLVDKILDEITTELLEIYRPDVLGLTVPFPGNVYGAFRIARLTKEVHPQVKVILGGGYVNTELRELEDVRVFDFFDALTFDDGERPFLSLLMHYLNPNPTRLLRTMVRDGGRVKLISHPELHDIPQKDTGVPTYEGLNLSQYLSIFEMPNPMHRIWSDGRWNKLTLAHGCYWKKCSFCDVSLDYIGRYEASPADLIINRMESMIAETGQSGFHFVDEAAPPALLKQMATRLIERGLNITWWGNVRFEKAFDQKTCELLAQSGCVAFSGGLEVASDRLLKLMNKGVSVEQVAQVTKNMTDAGIMVHAYLMFGFPTQTEQETIDALERVRQLFEAGCIQSAFWHRFSATAHSPIGKNPEKFGITLIPQDLKGKPRFARNDLSFKDETGTDHDFLGVGLKRALYNYMHGVGLDLEINRWFERKVPKTKVAQDLIANALQ
jgi:radical SAM superfamily enzyme YgiQ (UPF0313 family)